MPTTVQQYRTPTSITRNRIYVEKDGNCGENGNKMIVEEDECLRDIQESKYGHLVTDLTHHVYKTVGHPGVHIYDVKNPVEDTSSLPQEVNEYIIPEDFLRGMQRKVSSYPREMTFAYSRIVLRGLSEDGERFTATEIPPPGSVCIQRCLSVTDSMEFMSIHEQEVLRIYSKKEL
jgi:hypothetical protein